MRGWLDYHILTESHICLGFHMMSQLTNQAINNRLIKETLILSCRSVDTQMNFKAKVFIL